MSITIACVKCEGTGSAVHGKYRFLCEDCLGKKEVTTKLTESEIVFACRSFQKWMDIKYQNAPSKDRLFLSAWAMLDPDIDHSELLRRILSGGEVKTQEEYHGTTL